MPLTRNIFILSLTGALLLFPVRSSAFQPRIHLPVRLHPHPLGDPVMLTATDVDTVVKAAASSVNSDAMVIAVTDRQGNILAVYQKPNAPATARPISACRPTPGKSRWRSPARPGSFSNDQAPLSSRTVRYISGIHFPPGIAFTGNAALYGIENTNRGCPFNADYVPGQAFPPARSIDGMTTGLGILTGKANLNDSDPSGGKSGRRAACLSKV